MTNEVEQAERFDAVRALMAPFLGLAVLAAQQGLVFAWDWGSQSLWQIGLWLAFAILMLVLLLTSGGWLLPARVRQLANDEVTRSHRAVAIQVGFVVAMITGFIVWAVSPFEPLHAQRAANIIVSTSLGCAFVAFGAAELRHHG